MTTTYSNPRTEAVIDDWPIGNKRCTATFRIDRHPTRGERATRTTVGAPKVLTFARQSRIVDGDDGRTYIINLTDYGHVSVMKGDMKFSHEAVFEDDQRYPEIRALFRS